MGNTFIWGCNRLATVPPFKVGVVCPDREVHGHTQTDSHMSSSRPGFNSSCTPAPAGPIHIGQELPPLLPISDNPHYVSFLGLSVSALLSLCYLCCLREALRNSQVYSKLFFFF